MPVMQQSLGPQQSQTAQHPVLSMPTMQLNQQTNAVSSGALTAAQTQYFTQLTQQSNETLKTAGQASYSSTISSQVFKLRFIFHLFQVKEGTNLIIAMFSSHKGKRSNDLEFHRHRRSPRVQLKCQAML